MRTKEEIKKRLQEIEADERYQAGCKHPARVDINAPLALIQMGMEAEHAALTWVLGEEN